jgi:hypothetical protein
VDTASIRNWETNQCSPEFPYMPAIIRFVGYNPMPAASGFVGSGGSGGAPVWSFWVRPILSGQNVPPKKCFDRCSARMYILGGLSMKTYTIYTQCDHCGVYDRDNQWCALCQRPKNGSRENRANAPITRPPKADARLAVDGCRRS